MSNKNRRYLFPEEAEFLGLKVKKNQKGRNQARYWVTDEDYSDAKLFTSSGIVEDFNDNKIDPSTVKHLWKEIED